MLPTLLVLFFINKISSVRNCEYKQFRHVCQAFCEEIRHRKRGPPRVQGEGNGLISVTYQYITKYSEEKREHAVMNNQE
jgi:hypothetical protein